MRYGGLYVELKYPLLMRVFYLKVQIEALKDLGEHHIQRRRETSHGKPLFTLFL